MSVVLTRFFFGWFCVQVKTVRAPRRRNTGRTWSPNRARPSCSGTASNPNREPDGPTRPTPARQRKTRFQILPDDSKRRRISLRAHPRTCTHTHTHTPTHTHTHAHQTAEPVDYWILRSFRIGFRVDGTIAVVGGSSAGIFEQNELRFRNAVRDWSTTRQRRRPMRSRAAASSSAIGTWSVPFLRSTRPSIQNRNPRPSLGLLHVRAPFRRGILHSPHSVAVVLDVIATVPTCQSRSNLLRNRDCCILKRVLLQVLQVDSWTISTGARNDGPLSSTEDFSGSAALPLFSISVVNLSESSFTSTVATDLVEKMAQKSVVHSYRSTKFDMLYIRLDSLVVGRILLPPRELLQRTETMTTL